jgi:hypothetical protein
LSLPPKTRICKGLETSFRLCRHLSFSGQCLLKGLREMNKTELFCQAEHCRDIQGRLMVCMGGRESGPRVGFHGHVITMDRMIPVLRIGNSAKATHDLLSFALRKRRAYICPHLNSDSPELFGGRLLTADCPDHTPDYTVSEIEQQHYTTCHFGCACHRLRLGVCVTWSQCPNPDCFTRYCLRRIWNSPDHCIVLEVSRDLFGCPTHPAWLAQMEPQRETGEAKPQNWKKGAGFKCRARSIKCKQECVSARHSLFMNS